MADTMRTSPGSISGGGSTTGPATQSTGAIADRAIDDARQMGSELIGAVRDSATSLLDEQRGRAADEISALGEVLRRSARSLDDSGSGAVVRYADQAAEQITSFADGLRNRSWSELARDVEEFARSWPVAFMAGAVAAGFVAGRFLVSSAPQREPSTPEFRSPPMSEPMVGTQHDTARTGAGFPSTGQAGLGAGMNREKM